MSNTVTITRENYDLLVKASNAYMELQNVKEIDEVDMATLSSLFPSPVEETEEDLDAVINEFENEFQG